MSSKFGLDDEDQKPDSPDQKIDLSSFSAVRKRIPIDLDEVDAAAAPHGFISREARPKVIEPVGSRRRRAVPPEPARQLAVRLVESQYERFVSYADHYQLTYHDAIKKLLDEAGH